MSYRPTICLDFDGVLHAYSRGWQGGELYDGPTEGCREALVELAAMGRLVVQTAREEHRHEGVWAWLRQHGLADLIDEVTCTKPAAVVYVDDRAVHFQGSWQETVDVIKGRMQ